MGREISESSRCVAVVTRNWPVHGECNRSFRVQHIPAHRRSQHRSRSHPPFQYSRANRFYPWSARIVGTFGKARSQKKCARFPKRNDGSRRPHLHRAQSALPNLPGEKVLSRPRSCVASAKTKARENHLPHRIALFSHKRAHDFARALPPALARHVDVAKIPGAKVPADSSRTISLHSPPYHLGSFSRPIESADKWPTLVFASAAQSHSHPLTASPRHY